MERRVDQLPGAAPRGSYSFRSLKGGPTRKTGAVFPILNEEGSNLKVVGTGFYISHNGIFVTARHCFESAPGKISTDTPFLIFHALPDNQYLWRPVLRAWHSSIADVAVGVAAPAHHNQTREPLTCDSMVLTTERPAVGSRITTYAYAGSSIQKREFRTEIYFRPDFFEGRIVDYFPVKRDKCTVNWPVFETDMRIHGGASGGPVVNERGTVCAINTSSFEGIGVADISYVTPIDLILDAVVEGVVFEGCDASVSVTIRELAKRQSVAFDPAFPLRAPVG